MLETSLYEALRVYALSGDYSEPSHAARDLIRQALAADPEAAMAVAARGAALADVHRWAILRLRSFFHELEGELDRTTAPLTEGALR